MRLSFLILGLSTLLSGCMTTSSNHYTRTLQTWQGANVSTLTQQWGTPNTKIVNPNGQSVYVYRTQTYGTDNTPTPTAVGVNVSKTGRPIIVTPQDPGSSKPKLSLTCLAIFEANEKGVITHTEVRGNGCYGSSQFANKMMNPANKKPAF